MTYIKEDHKPELDLKNAISILISSEFLGMDKLVTVCVDYVVSKLNEVVWLPIDMSCLNQKLLNTIA